MKFRTIRITIIVLALLVCGIIFLVMGIKQKIEYNQPRARLETVTVDELHEGMFVEGEIYELWSEYAYTEESKSTLGIEHDKKTTDRYFALPMEYSFYPGMDAPMFIAVCTRDSSEISKMRTIAKESDNYYKNDIELKTSMHFVGKVQALKGEYLDYFKEYIAWDLGISEAEAAQYYKPYVIRSWKEDNSTTGIIIGAVMTALGLAGTIIFVVKIIKARRGY